MSKVRKRRAVLEDAGMYRMNRQMRIEDFVFPYGQLDKNNEWVKLADLVPWDEAEEVYAKQFVNNGHPAHPARIALGALIIKQRLKCSDEWTVRHISENPYLQYFLGLKEYTSKCPFGASTMVEFRKRPSGSHCCPAGSFRPQGRGRSGRSQRSERRRLR